MGVLYGSFILSNIWLSMILWGLVYLFDYYLTLYAARELRTQFHETLVHEGGYELTPVFRDDIHKLRPISRAFLWRWLLSMVLVFAVYRISLLLPYYGWILYDFMLGALLLREGAIYMRHARNIAVIRLGRHPGAMRGSIEYSRWFSLRASAVELASFGVFFLILALLLQSWFFFGGGLVTALTGLQHRLYARKTQPGLLGS
jgi:hypothetical protein